MSWIENTWAIVGNKQWHNLATFETTHRETWHDGTGDTRERMRTLIVKGGAKLKY